jgi:TrmH family RNA methyltransferase
MELISSRNNQKIKQVRLLKERKARLASGLAVVEGIFPVGEAVAAAQEHRVGVESIFYSPRLLKSVFASGLVDSLASQGVPCYATSEEVFTSIADKDNPQGILAVVRPVSCSLDELSPQNAPWCVALLAPQDPGNVGTVLRTLDAVGASCLILLENSLDPYQPGVVRASMGLVFWTPVVSASFADFVAWARLHGYHLYGTSARGQEDYRHVAYQKPCVLLLGSEREGLSADQRAACDMLVSLPMGGRATSLNLAVAAGVMLYAMRDQLGESTIIQ